MPALLQSTHMTTLLERLEPPFILETATKASRDGHNSGWIVDTNGKNVVQVAHYTDIEGRMLVEAMNLWFKEKKPTLAGKSRAIKYWIED